MAEEAGRVSTSAFKRIVAATKRVEATPFASGESSRPSISSVYIAKLRRFTCKTCLSPIASAETPTSEATAHPVYWDSDDSEYKVAIEEDYEFKVIDPSGERYCPAYDEDKWQWFIGWCCAAPDTDGWEIVSVPQWQLCKAQTAGAVANSDTSYTVDHVKPLFGTRATLSDSDTLTVQNTFGDEIDDNATVTISWNAPEALWETADVTCPA